MDIKRYIEIQSEWIKAEYLADYEIEDYPAISFESWGTADKQLEIMNRNRSKPIRWLGDISEGNKSRILYYPDSDFEQLWMLQTEKQYRSIAIKFITDKYGVTDISKNMHADHLMPRSKINHNFPAGVTVIYFVPSHVNTSWGGGHEKKTRTRSLKIRNGITLVSVAKAMGILGPSKSRPYKDVAEELVERGIISKSYDDKDFCGTYDEVTKVETELRFAASDLTAESLKVRSTKTTRSETMVNAGSIKVLKRNVPEKMENILTDSMVVSRRNFIDTWISVNQKLDSRGVQEIPLESIFQLFLKNQEIFPLDRIVQLVENVFTLRGAVAYLLDQTSVIGGRELFAKHGIFPFVDYDWEK